MEAKMKYDLKYSTPESEGIDSKGILEFINEIKIQQLKLHTFTLVRNEKIIEEINCYPFSNDYRHIVNSVTKTFTSAAIGILYDRKMINLDDKVHNYFDNPLYKENGLENLTIRHLLTMTLGHDAWVTIDKDYDWSERIFDKEVTYKPGSKFFYNSMASHMLSTIVTKVTGKNEAEFLKENFFNYCGIDDFYWLEDPRGNSIGGFGLFLPGKDLAKLGLLYLNKGVINGHRILSEEWCEMATSKQVETSTEYPAYKTQSTQGYGFQQWMCTNGGFRASGLYGQICVVLPKENIVFSINSSTAGSQPLMDIFFKTIYQHIYDYKLPKNGELREQIENVKKELDTKPLQNIYESKYEDKINGIELHYKDSFDTLKLSFNEDVCDMVLKVEGIEYVCHLGKNKYEISQNGFDRYVIGNKGFQSVTSIRPDDYSPITYGNYAWVSKTHLKIMIVFKDHTSYNYFDIYFDDKFARIDEEFTYLLEGHKYRNQKILIMP